VTAGTTALRLVVAAVLGAVVGIEREVAGQPAGLRTHSLVALGAALFTIVGLSYFEPPS
jgi:putative Mg2+ transporter-C (MgtC) family protein